MVCLVNYQRGEWEGVELRRYFSAFFFSFASIS